MLWWKRPGQETDAGQQHVQPASAAEVECYRCCCQYLVILESSGTACSQDAVAVAMCYLSPVYAGTGISRSTSFWMWLRWFATVWSCRCWSVVSPVLAIGRPKKKLTGWFCKLVSLGWNVIYQYSGVPNAHHIKPGLLGLLKTTIRQKWLQTSGQWPIFAPLWQSFSNNCLKIQLWNMYFLYF